MELKILVIGTLGAIAFLYGIWGLVILSSQEHATAIGNIFRKLYGTTNSDLGVEKSYDRYTRGIGAVILGFGLAYGATRAILIALD